MERLLENATALSGVEYDISSYADIVEAIHVVQTEMGITGTTAKEASSTIQGSLAMTKSAWENLLTGLADKNADLGGLIGNLTESVKTAAANLVPVITQALGSIGLMVQELAPVISEQLPALAQELLPALLSAGSALLTGVLDGIMQALPALIGPAVELVLQLGDFIIQNLPLLIEAASQIILQLATGIGQNLPALLPAIVDVVLQIVDTLIDNVGLLVDAAVEIITALAGGLIDALPRLLERAPEIIMKLVTALIQNVPLLLNAGAQAIGSLVGGILQNLPQIASSAGQIISTLWNALAGLPGQALQWGADMLQSFINGIASRVQNLWNSIRNIAQGVRDFLGFSEPKEGPLSDFHTYAPDMMALYAQGITQNRKKLTDALESVAGDMAIPFQDVPAPASPATGTATGGAASRGTSIGTVTFNIQAREDQDLDRLADEIMLRLYELVEGKRRQFA